jgi:ACT domain-containing protein
LLPEITGLRTSLHASTNPQIRPCPHAFAESQQHPNSRATAQPAPLSGRAIVTIIGSDRVGIIAGIANVIAEANVNILDISQSVIREFFTMIMMVDLSAATISFEALADNLARKGANLGVKVEIQREEIFKAMHRI